MTSMKYVLEVKLPTGQISAHGRRGKSIRHGRMSTLHIGWTQQPMVNVERQVAKMEEESSS